jgi:hypothetical protein
MRAYQKIISPHILLEFCSRHYLLERQMSSTTKQQQAAAPERPNGATQPAAGGFTRKMTTSKSGRFRERQNRRGSLFADEQGKSLFGDAATPPQQKNQQESANRSSPTSEPQAIFTMAL